MTLGSKSSIAGRRFPVFFLFLVGAFASENPIFKNSSECQRHCSYYTESRVTGQAFKTANCEKKPKEDTFECVCYTDFQYSTQLNSCKHAYAEDNACMILNYVFTVPAYVWLTVLTVGMINTKIKQYRRGFQRRSMLLLRPGHRQNLCDYCGNVVLQASHLILLMCLSRLIVHAVDGPQRYWLVMPGVSRVILDVGLKCYFVAGLFVFQAWGQVTNDTVRAQTKKRRCVTLPTVASRTKIVSFMIAVLSIVFSVNEIVPYTGRYTMYSYIYQITGLYVNGIIALLCSGGFIYYGREVISMLKKHGAAETEAQRKRREALNIMSFYIVFAGRCALTTLVGVGACQWIQLWVPYWGRCSCGLFYRLVEGVGIVLVLRLIEGGTRSRLWYCRMFQTPKEEVPRDPPAHIEENSIEVRRTHDFEDEEFDNVAVGEKTGE
jgi:hypothetical protein